MESYSQNNEQELILNFLGDKVGVFLDIGANDGRTLSNTMALRELGWGGIYVEPAKSAFASLFAQLGNDNPKLWAFNVAVSDYIGEADFYESGSHIDKNDTALLSTLEVGELRRWKGSNNQFEKTKCLVWDFNKLQLEAIKTGRSSGIYELISIDAEGCDLKILQQMDLKELGCKCLIIEYNGDEEAKIIIDAICAHFGMKLYHSNGENLIYVAE